MPTHYLKDIVPVILCLKVTHSLAEVKHKIPSPPPSRHITEEDDDISTFFHLVIPQPSDLFHPEPAPPPLQEPTGPTGPEITLSTVKISHKLPFGYKMY